MAAVSSRARSAAALRLLLGFVVVLVAACGGGGGGGDPPEPPDPLPTASLRASSSVVAQGAAVTLIWSSTDAITCTAGGGWTGTLGSAGTRAVASVTATTTFTVTCVGDGGSASASVTVEVAPRPTVTLTAEPKSVLPGETVVLSWTSADATTCTASDGWTGSRGPGGSETTSALTQTTSFTLQCSGAGGNRSETIAVIVATSLPAIEMVAAESLIQMGTFAEVRWSAASAAECVAVGDWSGARATAGRELLGPQTRDMSYGIECSNAFGTAAASVTVEVDDSVAIDSVDFLAEQTGLHFGGWGPTSGEPAAGLGKVRVRLRGPAQLANFVLTDMNGTEVQQLELAPEGLGGFYAGDIVVPNGPFGVAARGTRLDGAAFTASWTTKYRGSAVTIQFAPGVVQPRRGQTIDTHLRVHNAGSTGDATVFCSAPAELLLDPAATDVPLPAASTVDVPLRITAAANVTAAKARPAITCAVMVTSGATEGETNRTQLTLPIRMVP